MLIYIFYQLNLFIRSERWGDQKHRRQRNKKKETKILRCLSLPNWIKLIKLPLLQKLALKKLKKRFVLKIDSLSSTLKLSSKISINECFNKENLRKLWIISLLELVSNFLFRFDVLHYLHWWHDWFPVSKCPENNFLRSISFGVVLERADFIISKNRPRKSAVKPRKKRFHHILFLNII